MAAYEKILRARAGSTRGGVPPQYLVLDGQTFREAIREAQLSYEDGPTGGQAKYMGMVVVVIPTDGIPLIRAVGWPADEAERS